MGIREVLAAPYSPWQNTFAARLIGSIRADEFIEKRYVSTSPCTFRRRAEFSRLRRFKAQSQIAQWPT